MPRIRQPSRRRVSQRTSALNGRTRNPQNLIQTIALDESCIDLTTTEDETFVDLTTTRDSVSDAVDLEADTDVLDVTPEAFINGANDQSVVIIETPIAFGSNRERLRRAVDLLDDDGTEDLPPTPFTVTTTPRASGSAVISSPDPIKLQCPICLDDDKTIKRDKRKIASTKCGHVFCDTCINSAVRLQHVCPVCRKRLRQSDVHVLHI